jgi:gamma-glutamyl-gamma-aminobutyrate hydrolase PuuD
MRPIVGVTSYVESASWEIWANQAVADVGGLTATAWSDDGVVEAVEDPACRFVLGVQWHPEEAGDVRPFAALVSATRPGPFRRPGAKSGSA